MNAPRATYRLQVHRDFPLAAARAQVPYFARLGISHLYLSPILTARSGSMHGYDVVDHSQVNPELGGEEALRDLVATLRAHDMGLIVDIVPNHMAVGGSDNRLWLDVLEWGRLSRYANFFDIDWDVPDPALKNKILAPFLGDHYGKVLANGELSLQFDRDSGRFSVWYFEHRFPIAPATYPQLLRLGGAELADTGRLFREIAAHKPLNRGDAFAALCTTLAQQYRDDAGTRTALDQLLQRFAPTDDSGRALLHSLLERQHYRLACWRTAADEINWRRFFDVIQLAGIRIQEPAAFEVVHATTLRLYAEGLIDGVRIDHIDGLSDPRRYCRQLRKRLNQLAHQRPPQAPAGPAYFVVEKILAPEERLPTEWGVDGTTGYSFMNEVSALLHDPAGEAELAQLWTQRSGRSSDFEAESQRARRRILQELLAAEFNACALALHRVARSDPATRDWSLFAIRRVLEELLVRFPIYRTYADGRGRSAADDEVMRNAIEDARPHCRAADEPLLDLIDHWLGAQSLQQAAASPRERRQRLHAIARFQQLSSPLAAKSVEDTAFYRHGKLLSRNEVGANPAQFANSPQDFHAECERRAEYFPRALLATATHDHKRGEDLRARLAVISELPARWSAQLQPWFTRNAALKADPHWPLPGDEYMLYQMLVGGWPLALAPDDRDGLGQLCERLQQWWRKALREAKQLSSWGMPNLAYEEACLAFLQKLLDPAISPQFLAELTAFARALAPAGLLNGLAQTLLKLTAPGVPDIYQGCELWDFSFVDPDNRRPVDYTVCAALLDAGATPDDTADWMRGAIKQQLIARVLQCRREFPELFARGSYAPLRVEGPQAAHVFAFERRWRRQRLVVIATRLPLPLLHDDTLPPALRWRDTAVMLPAAAGWRDLLGSGPLQNFRVTCAELLSRWPCALLLHDGAAA